MKLSYVVAVLTVVLLRSAPSYQQNHKSVCAQPQNGCVGFKDKQDNFSSLHQCFMACNFQRVSRSKSQKAYLCTDNNTPCSPLTFFESPSSESPFRDWIQCLEICHSLTNDHGIVSPYFAICTSPGAGCFPFKHSEGIIDEFSKCYIDCHLTKENQTRRTELYACIPDLSMKCNPMQYFSPPEEEEPIELLRKCYDECGHEGGGEAIPAGPTPTPKVDGFRCKKESGLCAACTAKEDEEGGCVDQSTCEASCHRNKRVTAGPTPTPKVVGFRCKTESGLCAACTAEEEEEGVCVNQSTCEASCRRNERVTAGPTPTPKVVGFRCKTESGLCAACTAEEEEEGVCVNQSTCEASCRRNERVTAGPTPTPKVGGFRCKTESRLCAACTAEEDEEGVCVDQSTCEASCRRNELSVLRKQTNELTMRQSPWTQVSRASITIVFPALAVIRNCKVAEGVCAQIGRHADTFTILAGTRVSPGLTKIINNENPDDSRIIFRITGMRPELGYLLGYLVLTNDTVEINQTWSVPFIIGEFSPPIPYVIEKRETVILLNGLMGNDSVELQFAENKDGSGGQFTINILPVKTNCVNTTAETSDKLLPSETESANTV